MIKLMFAIKLLTDKSHKAKYNNLYQLHILMLIKRRPPQITCFVENKYRPKML